MGLNCKIGDIVHAVDVRNSDLQCDNLLGLSMTKEFRPSTSNIVGTDLSKYKIVGFNEFAVDFMSAIRVHKMPIALNRTGSDIIVSPAYGVFAINDEDVVLPEYLMLWFMRPDFDRYADFKSDSAIRGGYDWYELCNTDINLPSMYEQRKIVHDYQVITGRIDLLRKINFSLQNIIDANFEKFYSETCDTETVLSSVCTPTSSKRVFAEDYVSEGVPFYRGGEISLKKDGEPIEDPLFISREHYESIKETYGIPTEGDILITAVGTIGNSYLVENEEFYFKDGNIIWLKDFIEPEYRYFVYDFLQSNMFRTTLNLLYIGSTQIALTIVGLSGMKMNIPELPALQKYASQSAVIRKEIQRNQKELIELHNLKKLLLAKGA